MTTQLFVATGVFTVLAIIGQWRGGSDDDSPEPQDPNAPINWWRVLRAFAATIALAAFVAAITTHIGSME